MTASPTWTLNPKLDLVLERTTDVAPELVWRAWTEPEHLKQWFCPRPWTVSDCEIDLRPGGIFRTTMRSPEGEAFANLCCYLEVVPNRRLVWTNALEPGYRPVETIQSGADLFMTAVILLEPLGSGTKYTAIALHRNETDRAQHEAMGFEQGWGAAWDQLLELAQTM